VLTSLRVTGELLAAPEALTDGDWLRLLPGAFASDGFFAAVLRRRRAG
jgi:hypothetical protein